MAEQTMVIRGDAPMEDVPAAPKHAKENLIRLKAKIETRLEKAGHWSMRLTKTRAVIGEPYEMARKAEALVVYRGQHPVYLSLERLDEITEDTRLLQRDTEYVYTVIASEATRYWKNRRPVAHWVFRDKEGKEEKRPAKEEKRPAGRRKRSA